MPESFPPFSLRRLSSASPADMEALVTILVDCVADGASVSFMHPLSRERARSFWQGVLDDAARGERIVVVAEDGSGIAGTVQVVLAQPDNQPHRADISKMLVRPRARRRGLGEAPMRRAEDDARAAGKMLLVLDTADATAARLYRRCGWQFAGTIPQYALLPHGGLCDTHYFYRTLA